LATRTPVLHFVNQFFAGIGGEEEADIAPQWLDGPRGPGQLLTREAPDLEVVATVTAGDNFMAGNLSNGVERVLALIEENLDQLPRRPELLFAGPAFNAGRYGMACAAVCEAVEARLGIPAVTALYPENPAVDSYRASVTLVRAADNVLGMPEAVRGMIHVGAKLLRGEPIVSADDGTIARGLRQNYFSSANGAVRVLDMLMQKLAGESYETEYAMPVFDRVPPAPAVKDIRNATIAMVTSGGIVPRGNPDRIESASATKFGQYSIEGLQALTAATHQSIHGGYDPTYANVDPNRVLPVDALRALEKEGRFGRLHDTYYATVGNATSVRRAVRFGQEIAAILVNVGVHAVIITST
jgi:glycine reductase